MSNLNLYSIYDIKAKVHIQLFQEANDYSAIRSFKDIVNDSKFSISRYPADFALYAIGKFEQETGNLVTKTHELGIGSQFVIQKSTEANANV